MAENEPFCPHGIDPEIPKFRWNWHCLTKPVPLASAGDRPWSSQRLQIPKEISDRGSENVVEFLPKPLRSKGRSYVMSDTHHSHNGREFLLFSGKINFGINLLGLQYKFNLWMFNFSRSSRRNTSIDFYILHPILQWNSQQGKFNFPNYKYFTLPK